MPPEPPRPVIGLEVHVRLATGRKLFCRCAVDDEAAPNATTCPVCRGAPGALPVPDPAALRLALRAALALEATPSDTLAWHRKHYRWPDLPKGFQITQQGTPLATGGRIHDLHADRCWPVATLHVEEDAGRFDVRDGALHLDDNRAGVPLLEVTTPPCLHDGDAVEACLRALHATLVAAGVTAGHLHHGHLRADVNVSLAADDGTPGPKVEVKNVGSFRHAADAVRAEVDRQRAERAAGRAVDPHTRAWDGRASHRLRAKDETAYRILPEPDLPDVVVDGLALTRAAHGLHRPLGPWLRTLAARPEVAGRRRLARVVAAVAAGALTPATADPVLAGLMPADMPEPARPPDVAPQVLADTVAAVVAAHPVEVDRYRAGDTRLLGWFLGQVMGRLDRRADPHAVRTALVHALAP